VAYDYAMAFQNDKLTRTFTWNCPACQQIITDESPYWELPRQEEGHADDCPRWAAELAEWQKHKQLEEARAQSRRAVNAPEA
jgi:hypothetical protein